MEVILPESDPLEKLSFAIGDIAFESKRIGEEEVAAVSLVVAPVPVRWGGEVVRVTALLGHFPAQPSHSINAPHEVQWARHPRLIGAGHQKSTIAVKAHATCLRERSCIECPTQVPRLRGIAHPAIHVQLVSATIFIPPSHEEVIITPQNTLMRSSDASKVENRPTVLQVQANIHFHATVSFKHDRAVAIEVTGVAHVGAAW